VKLQIFLHKSDGKKVELKADMKEAQRTNVATCDLLFADLAKTKLAEGLELKKWKIKRGRDKWNGYAAEKSPDLKDGDTVTFYAERKAEA
jgi:hypothetical protein